MATLELDLLRTFVAIQDCGGYTQAGGRLGRTQSAVSLQVRRLESAADAPLFRRQGKRAVLTEQGEVLLRYARQMLALERQALEALGQQAAAGPVRIGCSQDFAESWLPAVLGSFARAHPTVHVDARVDRNAVLHQELASGALDLALLLDYGGAPTATVQGRLPVRWIGASAFPPPTGGDLPLALLPPPCPFRDRALRALDRAGVPWRIAFTSHSLSGLWSAVAAGLGVTVRTPVGLPGALRLLKPSRRLPALGHTDAALHRRPGELSAAAAALARLVEAEIARRIG